MSDHGDSSNTFDPFFRPLMDYWAAYTRQLNEAAELVSQSEGTADEDKSQDREWLDAASESIDAYLRSPLFLGLLRNHLSTLIELKRQSNALGQVSNASGAQAESGGADEIVRRLGELEAVLNRSLGRIEQRLEAVEQKLDNLEGPS
ncbi:hypothetical protein [Aeoliella sp.]|uniref:hypothetical protein n=1 Tax=Aeoliella sp. TaxID=2795800 RepID=UPI003CCB9962